MNKFWQVGIKDPYTIYAEKYACIEDAEREAERLAYEYGYTAFVLEPVSFFESNNFVSYLQMKVIKTSDCGLKLPL